MNASVSPQKVVLVTGASSGIGQCIAAYLAACGYRVFGTSRSGAALPDAADVTMLVMDVDDDASVARAIAALLQQAGRLDAVINNAGWALMGPIEETSMAEAREQMETNFFGLLRVCRAVLPILRGQSSGHIVNISSLGGVFGMPYSGLYSASKFAVEGLSESLRLETRRLGVKVVLIEPGDTQSQLPLKRREVQATGERSPYRSSYERFKAQQARDEAKAPTAHAVAALVERVLRHPNPALRHSVAKLDQRMVPFLKRLLPQRWFEALVGDAMGV